MPQIVFYGFTALATALLQARRRFAGPATGEAQAHLLPERGPTLVVPAEMMMTCPRARTGAAMRKAPTATTSPPAAAMIRLFVMSDPPLHFGEVD